MERRKLTRIPSTFLLTVQGVDAAPVRRQGDVSTSGIYFDTTLDLGPMGSVQALSIASVDGAHAVDVMAQLMRRVSAQDLWKGQVATGAAYRFMPDSAEKQRALDSLVHHVAGVELGRLTSQSQLPVLAPVPHTPAPLNLASASVARTSGLLVLDAVWALAPGEEVLLHLDAVASGKRVTVEARVATVAPVVTEKGLMHRTTLRVVGPEHAQPAASIQAGSLDDALDALAQHAEMESEAEELPPQDRFAGMVSFVTLPGLLSFLEIQRMSGTLTVTRAPDRASIHVRDGVVVDLDLAGAPAGKPREDILTVLTWQDGAFEFVKDDSPRVDRVRRPTMELILESARMTDEAAR